MKFYTLMVACTLTLVSTLASLGPAAAQERTKIILAHAQPQLTPSYAMASSLPRYMKYWEEENLDVEVITTQGSAAAIQLLVSGQADVMWGNPTNMIAAIQRGAAIKSVYSATRGDVFGVGINADNMAALKGQTVGVSSFASASTAYLKALLKEAKVDPDKDVSIVEVGVGARAVSAFVGKQVTALSLWDEQFAMLETRGVKFKKIVQDPKSDTAVSASLIVRNDTIVSKRAALVGLARGIAKAQVVMAALPEVAVRAHWALYPETGPRPGVDEKKALRAAVSVMAVRRQKNSKNALGTGRYGDVPLTSMVKFQDYLLETDQAKKKMDVNDYLSNELIDDINKFDEAAVIAKAKEAFK